MKLLMIFGPQAVGKMTVGHELEKITGLKLFHNHMTIDLVSPFFDYKTASGKRLVKLFRKEIFEEVAKSNLEGLIFTYVLDFDGPSDWNEVHKFVDIFESRGASIYYVELEADIEERLKRNRHPYRLHHKPKKRDIEWSEKDLRDSMKKHRLNSKNGEISYKNYLRINNTHISPEDVSKEIKEKFQL